MNEYIKRNEESLVSYWIRLYKNRQSYGLTFAECGELMNEVSGEDWNEAKWRRPIQGFFQVNEYLQQENPTGISSSELQEIQSEKLELEKEKIKMRDQKREMRNTLRQMARLEHLVDYVESATETLEPFELPVGNKDKINDSEAMVVISDWHLGMNIDSQFNRFNEDVARYRITKLKQKTYEKVIKDDIQRLHIANLGDLIHGAIHVSTRIQSEEDVIQQVIRASEYLKDFIGDFLKLGIDVKYYNVIGNHGRVSPNKQDVAGIEENFEKLILTILDTAFSSQLNYTSFDSKDGLIETEIKGRKGVLVHGDYDKGASIVAKLPQLLGYVPDFVIGGHFHRESIMDYGKTTCITNGSLCGSDDYAIQMRLGGKPSQKYLTFTDEGIEENNTIYL